MDKTTEKYKAMRADVLMQQAVIAEKIIEDRKKAEFNKPILEQPFIKTVKEWCKANNEEFNL